MHSVLVIILEVVPKYSAQMVFAKDNDMIGAFAANASIQSFNVCVLPRTLIVRQDLFYAHRLDALPKPLPIDAVPIPKEILRCGVPWKCFNDLLRSPLRRRISMYVEMNCLRPGFTQNVNRV